MCGRFSLVTSRDKLQQQLPFLEIDEAPEPSFNIAPTQQTPVIANDDPTHLKMMTWGLVPFWDKTGKPTGKFINARSETVASKPAFRRAFQRRRCLVPADSFYEWKKVDGKKVPYRIFLRNGNLLLFAGIWDEWTDGKNRLRSFSILTTTPNKEISVVHDRMPVVLPDKDAQWKWLMEDHPEQLQEYLHSPPDGIFDMYPVSTEVNYPSNNSPRLHEPWLPPATLF